MKNFLKKAQKKPAGEQASLLLPSPNSTLRPSRTNLDEYGALLAAEGKSNSYLELQIPLAASEKQKKNTQSRLQNVRPNSEVRYMVALALVVFGIWNIQSLMHHRHGENGLDGDRTNAFASQSSFSSLDPVLGMDLHGVERPSSSAPPSNIEADHALPTNSWYQNFLLMKDDQEPSQLQRAYAVPYMIDVVGAIPGIRVQQPHVFGMSTVVQITSVVQHGLTLGGGPPLNNPAISPISKRFSVHEMTPLGLTLEWGKKDTSTHMSSTIVRGMPYVTMHYDEVTSDSELLPTIMSSVDIHSMPTIDGTEEIVDCSKEEPAEVQFELELSFTESDFTWLVFFSRPVLVKCQTHAPEPGLGQHGFTLQIVGLASDQEEAEDANNLTVRMALKNDCTRGSNPTYCGKGRAHRDQTEYGLALREHAVVYPGRFSDVSYGVDGDDATISFDWDPQIMGNSPAAKRQRMLDSSDRKLMMYALPHHLETIEEDDVDNLSTEWGRRFCTPALLGYTCAVQGARWNLPQRLSDLSFRAPRQPRIKDIPFIAKSLQDDIHYSVPENYRKGYGDTYFSGKMLARLGRILLVAEELLEICSSNPSEEMKEACAIEELPSQYEMDEAIARLRSSVEVWFDETSGTPFVYDSLWGGLVHCGCFFNGDTGACDNQFPNCPSFNDPGLNFGNGFYNDHHFHLGYHIYASAVVAHFDPKWGRDTFDKVLLYIRDIANPSSKDPFFTAFRHKDWYQGSSWASGISVTPLNGRNQESSSEAIAAYEAVGLYGQEMMKAWREGSLFGDSKNMGISKNIRDVGRLLTATELRAADKYWHVHQSVNKWRIYPTQYTPHVIGVMWNAMAQFQTWFGNAPYLPYGIQLLPLTPISEIRDDEEWAKEMYEPFSKSCYKDIVCQEQGWSILQLAILATVGHRDAAIERTRALPSKVFESAGGNGHSSSNTLWYLSTRPAVEPLKLHKAEKDKHTEINAVDNGEIAPVVVDCGCSEICTDAILDRDAGGFTCRARIEYLMITHSQKSACRQVAGTEFPDACGVCDPLRCGLPESDDTKPSNSDCPPCSREICQSQMNVCPMNTAPFLCTSGGSRGGCSRAPWGFDAVQCTGCCELVAGCENR